MRVILSCCVACRLAVEIPSSEVLPLVYGAKPLKRKAFLRTGTVKSLPYLHNSRGHEDNSKLKHRILSGCHDDITDHDTTQQRNPLGALCDNMSGITALHFCIFRGNNQQVSRFVMSSPPHFAPTRRLMRRCLYYFSYIS